MKALRFSVIVTCHNQRDFIREAVDSALTQAGDDTEVIVVDDVSSDGSVELLKAYGDRIRFCRMPANGGAPRARNLGASMAGGQYLVFLDGDDVLMPHALKVYNRLVDARRPMLILAPISPFSGSVPRTRLDDVPNSAARFVEYSSAMSKDRAADLSASAMVVDRAAFLEVGGWTPDIFHGDNKDLMMKLGYAGSLLLILAPKTVFYRLHDRNSIHDISLFLKNADRLITNERAGHYPGGRAHLFERYAALGVFVLFWSMKGLTVGLWRDVFRVTMAGFPMIVAGTLQRCTIRLKGLPPAESLELADAPSSEVCGPSDGARHQGLESRQSRQHG